MATLAKAIATISTELDTIDGNLVVTDEIGLKDQRRIFKRAATLLNELPVEDADSQEKKGFDASRTPELVHSQAG